MNIPWPTTTLGLTLWMVGIVIVAFVIFAPIQTYLVRREGPIAWLLSATYVSFHGLVYAIGWFTVGRKRAAVRREVAMAFGNHPAGKKRAKPKRVKPFVQIQNAHAEGHLAKWETELDDVPVATIASLYDGAR